MTKKILGKTLLATALSCVCANASDLWQTNWSLEVSPASGLSSSYTSGLSSSYTSGLSSSYASQPAVSSSVNSWFSSSAWGGGLGVSTASSAPVAADDVFRSALFSNNNSYSSNTASSWSLGAPATPAVTSTSYSYASSATTSYASSWSLGSTSSTSSYAYPSYSSLGYSSYNGFSGWSLGGTASGGGTSYQTANSDLAACNMVSSWAAPAAFWSLSGASYAVTSGGSGCSQTQASTVGSLAGAPSTGSLPGLGAPVESQIIPADVTPTIPEPSTVLMVGAGIAFAWLRRRS